MPTGTILATKFWRCAKAILVSLIILGVGQANAQVLGLRSTVSIASQLSTSAMSVPTQLKPVKLSDALRLVNHLRFAVHTTRAV